jgi:hypothetical protein
MVRIPLPRLLAVLAAVAAWALAPLSPGAAAQPAVTMVGDSVAAGLVESSSAEAVLGAGLALHLDLRVCRRLVEPSCAWQGSAPPTALQAIEHARAPLGSVLVVDVGYNEGPAGYGAGVDRIVRAATARGVRRLIWVTLRTVGPYARLYRQTNAEIRAAAARWPQLAVADWNARSSGNASWFAGDGLHLSPRGAAAMAAFLRPYVVSALHGAS